MGACFSFGDPIIMKIGTKFVRHSEFQRINTYRDAVELAGQYVPEYTHLIIVSKGVSTTLMGHEHFQFVDEIRYKGIRYPIKKLYGKRR
jgi:hypothetical protein